MDIISIVLLITCLSSPFFLLVAIWLGVLLFNERKNKQIERQMSLETLRQLESKINTLTTDALRSLREQWFVEVFNANYTSELDVEIKFIYLLMRFLNYGVNDLQTQVPIEVQVGRQRASGIADWVVYHQGTNNPFLVIEAKEPNQVLSDNIQEQARSYAYGLNAPFYMLTNGREIQIFERKVDNDIQVISFATKELAKNWSKMEQAIGKR